MGPVNKYPAAGSVQSGHDKVSVGLCCALTNDNDPGELEELFSSLQITTRSGWMYTNSALITAYTSVETWDYYRRTTEMNMDRSEVSALQVDAPKITIFMKRAYCTSAACSQGGSKIGLHVNLQVPEKI